MKSILVTIEEVISQSFFIDVEDGVQDPLESAMIKASQAYDRGDIVLDNYCVCETSIAAQDETTHKKLYGIYRH